MKLFLYPVILLGLLSCTSSDITPTQLTTEYLNNPSVVDVLNPRLSWINQAKEGVRSQSQTAYQVRVASTQSGLSSPDLWDSEKVNSDQSIRVKYDGAPLQSGQDCWWQVRTWDKNGQFSASCSTESDNRN